MAVRNQLSFTRVRKKQKQSESTDNDSDSDDVILAKYDSSDCSSSSSMLPDSVDDRNDNRSDGMNNNEDSTSLQLCGHVRTRYCRVIKPTARSSNYLF